MSTAAQSWLAKKPGRRLSVAWLAFVCLLCPFPLRGQATGSAALANQQKAHAVLAATIQALGGQAGLDVCNSRCQVRIASFFQGEPTGEVTDATVTSVFPDDARVDVERGRVIQIVSGRRGWEITYKGKKDLPEEKLDDILRWRDHSLATVLREWYGNPATVLIDQGPSQVERRGTEKIMLIHSAKDGSGSDGNANDAVTLEIDAESHLPLRLSFTWRDPRFHDKNLDAVEYDNYHQIDGIATPFTMTQTHNGEVVSQLYVLKAQYNVAVQRDAFDPNRAAAHLK